MIINKNIGIYIWVDMVECFKKVILVWICIIEICFEQYTRYNLQTPLVDINLVGIHKWIRDYSLLISNDDVEIL